MPVYELRRAECYEPPQSTARICRPSALLTEPDVTGWAQFALLVASWSALTGGIWKLFERADKVASVDIRQQTVAWLNNVEVARRFDRFAATFAGAFDAVFGARHLSWRCFGRSCVASFVWTGVLSLLWASMEWSDGRSQGVFFILVWWILFTAWLWLFGLSAMLIKSAHGMNRVWRFLRRALDVEKQPFMSLAMVCIAIVTLLYIAAVPAVLWYR